MAENNPEDISGGDISGGDIPEDISIHEPPSYLLPKEDYSELSADIARESPVRAEITINYPEPIVFPQPVAENNQ